MDPGQLWQNGPWARAWLLSMKSQGVSQGESALKITGQRWMDVELEIMSLSALLQRHSEKADWAAAFSMGSDAVVCLIL